MQKTGGYDRIPPLVPQGGMCMKGNIYSEEHCSICGKRLKYREKFGIACPDHPQVRGDGCKVQFKGIWRRFNHWQEAERWLNSVRYDVDQETFDVRDHQTSRPLGFENLTSKYLEYKKDFASYRQMRWHLDLAIRVFGNTNIKNIGYGELQDFFELKGEKAKEVLGDKSKKTLRNIKTTLSAFWKWVHRREKISIPEFPEVVADDNFRDPTDKQTQQRIIDKIYENTFDTNPRVWIAVKFLATYCMRPKELRTIKERDISIERCELIIRHPKAPQKRTPKIYELTFEDLTLLKQHMTDNPDEYFFRHETGYGGVQRGEPFGKDYLYKVWRRACRDLAIDYISLYPGTKHTTITEMNDEYSWEDISEATGVKSSLVHYLRTKKSKKRKLFESAAPKMPVVKDLSKKIGGSAGAQVIEFKDKK